MANEEDVVGIRVSFWLKADVDKALATNKWLISVGKPNTYLQEPLGSMISNLDPEVGADAD